MLDGPEKVVTDRGYTDEKCATESVDLQFSDGFFSRVRAKHEVINRRIK